MALIFGVIFTNTPFDQLPSISEVLRNDRVWPSFTIHVIYSQVYLIAAARCCTGKQLSGCIVNIET